MTQARLTAAVFQPARGPRQLMLLARGAEGQPAEVIAVLTVQSERTRAGEASLLESIAAAIDAAQLGIRL